MAVKTFAVGELVTASDANTYFANSGLVFVSQTSFTTVPDVQINNCFSSEYTRFRVLFTLNGDNTAARYAHFRLSVGGTPSTTGYYSKSIWYNMGTGTSAPADYDVQTSRFCLGPSGGSGSQPMMASVDIFQPNVAGHTSMHMNGSAAYYGNGFFHYIGGGTHTVNTAYDGLYFAPTGNNVTGTIIVYGYRNS